MPILKGKWKWNDTINLTGEGTESVSCVSIINNIEISSIGWTSVFLFYYNVDAPGTRIYIYHNATGTGKYQEPDYRELDFGEGQEVSDTFYTFFTANATESKFFEISGNWKWKNSTYSIVPAEDLSFTADNISFTSGSSIGDLITYDRLAVEANSNNSLQVSYWVERNGVIEGIDAINTEISGDFDRAKAYGLNYFDFGETPQIIPEQAYNFITKYAERSPRLSVQGKWYFKDTITLIPCYEPVTFTTELGKSYTGIGKNVYYLFYQDPTLGVGMGVYENTTQWLSEQDRVIDFGTAPQRVTERFYNWFIKNAVPLTIEGTWRFNKTLILPTKNLPSAPCLQADIFSTGFSEGQCTSKHYPEYSTGLYFLSLTYTNLPEYNRFGYGLEGNFHEGDSYYCLWTSDSGWVSEEARILTFHDRTELDPKFALWFYENAHPTKIVLCSEAYVAEIAHNIRQIKRTTQRYAVKNLANEIRNLYKNANEEVY